MPSKREAIVARALSLVGCGYIYGATGWICTERRLLQQARQYPMYAEQMEKYGPRWMGKPCFDCAQFTRTAAREAGVEMPSGATSQWRALGLWKEKGLIDTLPDEGGLFLFTMRDGRMTHTGVSLGRGEEADARGHAYGVVRRPIGQTTFTHWARLNIDYDAPIEAENPSPDGEKHPTLRRGSEGSDVEVLQNALKLLGYDLGEADGKFGKRTQESVQRFQEDYGLQADGVAGPSTWEMLLHAIPGEDEEAPVLTRLVLTGAPMHALIRALESAEDERENKLMRLHKRDYEKLMQQIDLEG